MKVYQVSNAKVGQGLSLSWARSLPELFFQIGPTIQSPAPKSSSLVPVNAKTCLLPSITSTVIPEWVGERGVIECASIVHCSDKGVGLVQEIDDDRSNALVFLNFDSGFDGFALFLGLDPEEIDCPNRNKRNFYTCLNPRRCALCGEMVTNDCKHPDRGTCLTPLEGKSGLESLAYYTRFGDPVTAYYVLYQLIPGQSVRVRAVNTVSSLWPAVVDVHWDGEELTCNPPEQPQCLIAGECVAIEN
jgi:hypothetical protein